MKPLARTGGTSRSLSFWLGALALTTGCAQIAGIDQAPTDPNASATGSASLCNTYCDTVMNNCKDPDYVYASRDACTGVCQAFVQLNLVGDPQQAIGNTLNCRLKQATAAGPTGEPAQYCPSAGPGGNGVCGSNCEGYCYLMMQICPAEFATDQFQNSLSYCLAQCANIPVLDAGFDADQQSGNTINCRLYHVSAAAAAAVAGLDDQTALHCTHAAGASPCVDPASQ